MKSVRLLFVVGFVCLLTSTFVRAQDNVRINEFMAQNANGLDDENGDEEDWIELHNAGSNAVNLLGWSLTDTTKNLRKWVFPAVTLPTNGYLIVFASDKDRKVGELHTNFKLADEGEYLGLIRSNGTVASEFYPTYPIQAPDISYGLRGSTSQETLLAQGAPAKALVPPDGSLEPPPGPDPLRPWTLGDLDDSTWQNGFTGVGYDTQGGYSSLLGLNVPGMQNVNHTVYIRIPFTVVDPSKITALTLRMRFDDGFIAYLNGRAVAWDNAPDPGVTPWSWTNSAPNNRDEAAAVVPVNYNISSSISVLTPGSDNLLAVQGLNVTIGSSDLLMLPELAATVSGSTAFALRYFPVPTPGGPNNAGIVELGPIIDQEDHRPALPAASDSIRVTARLRTTRGTVAAASLHYRTNYGPTVTMPFLDNGNNGDEGTNDLVYGAVIPASALAAGRMVRWYITATDTFGGNSRLPTFPEPLASPEYFGTIVADPALTNPLPVLYWFIQNFSDANSSLNTRCSLFFDGEFYDNVGINSHGQSSLGFPKKSYDIDFHPGFNFKWKEGEPRADDINLLTTYPDKAHMRNVLAYETYRDADNPHHWVIPVRVQQNGVFWATAHIVENGDEDWLVRMGLNSQGALYKMYNQFNSSGSTTAGGGAEKKTRKNETNGDLSALFSGISLTGEARRRYLYDNLDVAQVVNFLAARIITGDTDCCHKNYYFYRDTGFSGEWTMWPWDVDLSFGRVWTSARTYWEQIMYPNTPLRIGDNNNFVLAVFNTPEMYQMYLRRIRTLMDELLKPPGTLLEGLHYEPRIDELAALIGRDAALDAAKWNSHAWGNGSTAPCCAQPFPAAVAEMRDSYLPARRSFMYGLSALPGAQPPGTVINFGAIEANPSGGNQEQEYIQLRNPNAFAVDISGWRLGGAVQFVFRGGTIIPASSNLFVAANRAAWRTRAAAPTGNQAIHVVGDYEGRLSARGEALELVDRLGVRVASVNTPSNPSPAELFLRITEIMYHPPYLPQSDIYERDEYEYIELKNIGTTQLNLAGVRFSGGIFFNFTGSAITTLAAGQRVLVVRNLDAFTQRYGPAVAARVAGVYTDNLGGPGALDNAGEEIRLDDANNEKILEFDYNNTWYPITDGRGFSLVIIDPLAPFQTWDLKESWRPSGREYGSPNADDSPLAPVPGILVNEVLTHTDLPQIDAIELFNPTAATVDVSHWYITDDPGDPKKFRIPPGTTIPAGGHISFDEDDFNPQPGLPPSFSFSSTGDEAFLYSGNAAGELTGYHHGYSLEAAATGVSFGRYVDTQGVEHFVAMAALTLNAANSGPRVGPVVIGEVHYHPPQKREGVELVENFEDEYIELLNITASPVPLFDPAHPANTWRLRGGVDFDFPPNVTLPANGRLLVVSFDPVNNSADAAAFRARHGLSGSVLLAGPFAGQLGNEGDDIRLRRPDTPVPPPDPQQGLVPSILVDQVIYSDATPWPVAADGLGPSLQRITPGGFGNTHVNWTAATTTPAGGYPGGNRPAISAQPTNKTVVVSADATFTVTATGDVPLRYQWTYNGDVLPGKTNVSLLLQNVQIGQQGAYRVSVMNAAGSVESTNAFLVVVIPARITQQPQDTSAHLSATAIFVVQAYSSTPISYRWRKNGVVMPGRTDSFLSIQNVTQNDAGLYDVEVTDTVGTIFSDQARLTVLVNPVITTQPINQNVTVLSPINVTNTVAATSGTPLRYQWYFNGNAMVPTANIPAVTNAALIITNVGLTHAGDYFVIVRDNFGAATSVVVRLTVNTRAEYTQQPISQAVPEGGIASFSASWSGSGPFLHRWRRTLPAPAVTLGFLGPTQGLGRLLVANGYITASSTNSVLVLTNVSASLAGSYDIVVSNSVGQGASAAGALTVIADADRDGLPDSWETGRPGFNINDPSDALRDDDLDGMSNGAEYFAGTDYLNTTNHLRSAIQLSGSVLLSFGAASNKNYMVQYSDLLNLSWSNLVIEPAKSNARVVNVLDPTPAAKRYYRLVTPAQP